MTVFLAGKLLGGSEFDDSDFSAFASFRLAAESFGLKINDFTRISDGLFLADGFPSPAIMPLTVRNEL